MDILKKWSEEGEDFFVCNSDFDKEPIRQLINSYATLKKTIPWKALEDQGWIARGQRGLGVIAPYLLANGNSSRALFRKSTSEELIQIELWKSRVYMRASEVLAANPGLRFKEGSINKEYLTELAQLSVDPSALIRLPAILLRKGIVLIYELGLPGIKTDGVVFKTEDGIPVVGLTLRYSRLDNFWFTLLHELSHVIKHYSLIDEVIVEDFGDQVKSSSKIEKQADRLAKSSIVPRQLWERCEARYTRNSASILSLAAQLSIHPALLAGMMRRELNNYRLFSDLVSEVDVRDIIFGEA
jgi:HTH-type transcriptional regulator/antitoxin HigA